MRTALTLIVIVVGLTACANIPGAPTCNEVKYERTGDIFMFTCKGQAGAVAGSPL